MTALYQSSHLNYAWYCPTLGPDNVAVETFPGGDTSVVDIDIVETEHQSQLIHIPKKADGTLGFTARLVHP